MSVPASYPKPTFQLANRLAAAHHGSFVGREAELRLFHTALQEAIPSFTVLHIYGVAGIGKTTLLREYAQMATEMGIPVFLLDSRSIKASPAGFLQALRSAIGLDEDTAIINFLSSQSRCVLLIDTYEVLFSLDNWLREEFLPQLTEHSLVVIAGRNQPAAAWRTHLAWREVTRAVSIRNLRPEESKTFLTAQGVPEKQHAAVITFTHGHPLALSLVTDVLNHSAKQTTFTPEQEPDVVRVLLHCFLQQVPSTKHRQALEICAHARVTTEALLTSVLEGDDVPAIFEWLRGLSFIEQGPQGLFPHDLVREILDTDLRWRNPEGYRQMHRKIRNYYQQKMQRQNDLEQQHTMADIMYLHRNNLFMRPYYDYQSLGTTYAEPATPEHHSIIIDMVRQHEGEEAACIVQYWLYRQPQAFLLFRGNEKEIIGFTTFLAVHEATAEDLTIDPGMQTAWHFIQKYRPVRPGEEAFYQRFWMGRDTYQAAGPAADLVHITGGSRIMVNPKIAWTMVACADSNYWRPMYTYINFHHSPETDFIIGGKQYGIFHHDWRAEPLWDWMEQMVERELSTDFQIEQSAVSLSTPLIVLSEPDFAEAVRTALKNYHRTSALAKNPLMRSRLVAYSTGGTPTVGMLQTIVREAVEILSTHPKDEKLYRAVHRTYIKSSLTQEDAADSLRLPFSTYRYHLANGIKRITEWLWQRELYGADT